jgi:hypothetical protein
MKYQLLEGLHIILFVEDCGWTRCSSSMQTFTGRAYKDRKGSGKVWKGSGKLISQSVMGTLNASKGVGIEALYCYTPVRMRPNESV